MNIYMEYLKAGTVKDLINFKKNNLPENELKFSNW